ncbi:hypothetical protein Tco_0595259 [Tanacetum coccineum]
MLLLVQEMLRRLDADKIIVILEDILGDILGKALYGLKQAPRAWNQANPNESHLVDVKRIFRYLKGTPNLGLWYPKGSGFDLKAYSNSDYAGCNLDRKSTLGGCQILRGKLVCWSAKKQSSVAMSSAEAEYVVAAGCCTQVLWIKSQTMMFSMTRYHFIRDYILKGDIKLHFVPTDLQLADIFTKPLAEPSFTRLVVALLEHLNELYRPLLSFFSNCCISKALTLQLSAIYVEYLKEFWYSAEFISTIGLPICKDVVPLPPKETVRAGLETLDLVHKLQNGKKNRESNICYTRFLSLIFEKLLGEKYISNDLTLVKPHTISVASFQKPLASKVPLTLHMLKVAKLSEEPEESTIPPSREVNADDTADKSLSRAYVQPVTQPKAPTDLKTRATPNPIESQSQHLYSKSSIHFVSALRVQDQKIEEVKEFELDPMEDVTFDQIMDEIDQRNKDAGKAESPYDTESEIKIIKSFQGSQRSAADDTDVIDITPKDDKGDAYESRLCLMTDDDLASLTGFKTQYSSDHFSDAGTKTLHASANKPAQSNPLGHLHEELCLLKNKLPGQLKDALKDTHPQLIKDSIKNSILESIAEELPHALVLHTSEEKSSGEKNTDDQPPLKNLKLLIPTSSAIPSPTPLNSIMSKLQKPDANKMMMDQFTEHLTNTTSYIFSPSPLREPTLPRDEHKGKENLKLATIMAQTQKMAEHDAKRKNMFDEYNHQITHRADLLPITKISYRVNSSKEATMRITIVNDPLNITVHDRFRLKYLGFCEWLETRALGIPPPPELSSFGILVEDRKRKRTSEILQQVSFKENIVVDGMKRNLAPPLGVEGRKGLVIKEPEEGIFYYNRNFDLVFQRVSELHLATTAQLIGLQGSIIRDTEAEEVYNLMELEIESREDVTNVREIVKNNLDGMGQHM